MPDACSVTAAYEDPAGITASEPWALIGVGDETGSPSSAAYLHISQSGKPLNQSLTEPAGIYGGKKVGVVLDFGTPQRVASDPITGQWPAQRQEISDDDAGKILQHFRALYGSDLKAASFRQFLTSHAHRIAGGEPRLRFEGLIETDPQGAHRQHRLSITDVIGRNYQVKLADVKIPQRPIPGANVTGGGDPVFGTHDFPGFADPDVRNPRAVPIVVGPLSGAALGSPGAEQCVIPLICVGPFLCADMVTRICGLLSGHAHTGGVQRLSQPDGTDEQLIPDDDANAWWPGKADWAMVNPSGAVLYTDINGHRYTLCFFDGQRGEDFSTGAKPIYANVAGPDTNADGTGDEITDAFALKKWLWVNWLEPTPGYQSGPWLTPSTFEPYPGRPSRCRINTDSFATSSAVSALYNGDTVTPFRWGGYLGPQQLDRREVIAGMNRSSWSVTTFNEHWQITDVMLDRRRDVFLGTKRTLNAYRKGDIQKDPPFVPDEPRSNWHCTNLRVLYGLNPRTNQYVGDIQDPSFDPSAFLKYGTIYQEVTLPFVADFDTAKAIHTQMLEFMQWLPKGATWARPWHGLEDDVGQGRAITHPAGNHGAGYQDAAFWILGQQDQINRRRIVNTGVYVDHLLTY